MSKEKETTQGAPADEQPVETGSGEHGAQDQGPAVTAEELTALLEKLDQTTAEVTQHKERYLRSVADLENYRKRAIREK